MPSAKFNDETGSVVLEFLGFGVLLQVPILMFATAVLGLQHDKFAAAWLRELIKAGEIAAGEVDERSIVDVEAADLLGFTQCHFFAGIGGWSLALRLAGWGDDRPELADPRRFHARGVGRGAVPRDSVPHPAA